MDRRTLACRGRAAGRYRTAVLGFRIHWAADAAHDRQPRCGVAERRTRPGMVARRGCARAGGPPVHFQLLHPGDDRADGHARLARVRGRGETVGESQLSAACHRAFRLAGRVEGLCEVLCNGRVTTRVSRLMPRFRTTDYE